MREIYTQVLGYIGIDQYGSHYNIKKHPRKELLEYLDRKHARKMYIDTTTGKAKHVGYVIGNLWINVYAVCEWKPTEE